LTIGHSLGKGGKTMLVGSFRHQLDAKNRIRIPATYKAQMQGGLVMCVSVNGCIGVYTIEGFEKTFASYNDVNAFNAEQQKRYTKFLAGVYNVEEDNQGRILLPEKLRSFAGIKKDVVTVGKLNHLEIWSSERLAVIEDEESFEETFAFLSGEVNA
jgi:MraZ protein